MMFAHASPSAKGTFSNIEQQSIEVVRDCLVPWCRRFELEANIKLFSTGEKFKTRFDLTDLLSGDSAARASYYSTLRNCGVLSVNDILRAEGRPSIGPEGDVRVMQSQYVPLDKLGTQGVASPAPGTTPAPKSAKAASAP